MSFNEAKFVLGFTCYCWAQDELAYDVATVPKARSRLPIVIDSYLLWTRRRLTMRCRKYRSAIVFKVAHCCFLFLGLTLSVL